MGSRYARELEALPRTYGIAKAWKIDKLTRALSGTTDKSLVAVGSGGSFSVATYCAGLHRHFARGTARSATPLAYLEQKSSNETAVLCVSASGRNADIRAAFLKGLQSEARPAIAFTLGAENPLHELAAEYQYSDAVNGPMPAEPDGFLAVNSVVATCLTFARAYRDLCGFQDTFPDTFEDFISSSLDRSLVDIQAAIGKRSEGRSLSVLYSPDIEASAVDLESRFVEAALSPLHIADLRNFGHGRHNWIAKKTDETLAVALATDRYRDLALRTLKLFPMGSHTEIVHITGDADVAGLAALVASLYISAGVGQAVGVDPGRPGIPEFGRKLFHLTPPRELTKVSAKQSIYSRKKSAIDRVGGKSDEHAIRRAFEAAEKALKSAAIRAVVLDYDGTVCDPRARFDPLPPTTITALTKVLNLGLPIAIAPDGVGQWASL